jgi:ABC-type polysaccharide/polyol phosphate export permease
MKTIKLRLRLFRDFLLPGLGMMLMIAVMWAILRFLGSTKDFETYLHEWSFVPFLLVVGGLWQGFVRVISEIVTALNDNQKIDLQ